MTTKEPEPTRFLDVPRISEKTSVETLQGWATKHWPNEGRERVAENIVKNLKELGIVSDPDLNRILASIRYSQYGIYIGEPAIVKGKAPLIGGVAASASWPMHAPQMVYLSARCVVEMAGSGGELEDLKIKIREGTLDYVDEHLPSPGLYIEILDFLLRNSKRRSLFRNLVSLLREGNVEGAHKLMESRTASAGGRGKVIKFQ